MNGQEMPRYLGLKLVHASEMSEAQFTNLVKNEPFDPNKEDIPGYLVVDEDGYKSWLPKDVFEKAYKQFKTVYSDLRNGMELIKNFKLHLPHEQRLIDELSELDKKIGKLFDFIDNDIFETLSPEEQMLLDKQLWAMHYYCSILIERVNKIPTK